MEQERSSFDAQCLDALAALGKTVLQLGLYGAEHPSVLETLKGAEDLIGAALASSPQGSLTFAKDQDKWLVNGRTVGLVKQVGGPVSVLIDRHKLSSVTLKAGLATKDLVAICELSALGHDSGVDAQSFLAERGAGGVVLNEAVYAEVGPDGKPALKPGEGGGGDEDPAPGVEKEAGLRKQIEGQTLETSIQVLVKKVARGPDEEALLFRLIMEQLRRDIEKNVTQATMVLRKEKGVVEFERARTENILDNVGAGAIVVDEGGNILMMNPAAEEIAGTKLADAVGKHISEHLRPGEHFLTLSKDMDLSGENQLTGGVDQRGDEQVGRALRRSVALLEDDEGRVLGAYTTLPEISKFREAQKLQEEFLSRITHDLQSPLSSIASALEMLTEAAGTKLDDTENKFLDISIRNSRRLSQMIKGILDFSKLQSGKLDMHPQPAAVAPLVTEAVEGLVPWAKTKGISLVMRPVPPDLHALADGPRIVQVITNLISNAIKATPEGGTVTVAAACNPAEEGGVLIGVRDTGHGIPKADLDKLFHKFVQLSSYDTQEGVGLGLAIVSDFVKLHGGRVWVESEEGKGSTFFFTLQPAEAACPALL